MAKAEIQYVQFYTTGSAAPDLVPSYRPEKEAAKRTKKSAMTVIYVDPVAILGVITSVILMICLLVGVHNYNKALENNAELRAENVALSQKTEDLQNQYKDSFDLEEIRMEAILADYVPGSQLKHVTVEIPQAQPEPEQPGKLQQFWNDVVELFA